MKFLKKLYQEGDKLSEIILNNHFGINNPEKEFDVHDAVIIGLFEDMIGKTKSLLILMENESFNGTDALTRMMMENYIFLKFILQQDTVNRGKSYSYSSKLRQVKFFNTLVEQSIMGSELRKYLSLTVDNLNEKFPKMADKDSVEEIEENYINSLNHKDLKQKWYNINGKINNFRALCKHMKFEKEYILLYQTFSGEIHALDVANYFNFEKGMVEVFRKEGDIYTHVVIITQFLLDIIRDIYSYYGLKEELKRFNGLIKLNYKIMK